MALIELTTSNEVSSQVQYSDDFKQNFEALIRALQSGNEAAAQEAFAALKRNFQKVPRPSVRKGRRRVVQKRQKITPTLLNKTPA